MLANEGLLARHLSRNLHNQQYVESEGEKTLMLLRQFRSSQIQGDSIAESFAQNLYDRRHGVGAFLLCPETKEYLMTLLEMSAHYHVPELLSLHWMRKHLSNVYGGVSAQYVGVDISDNEVYFVGARGDCYIWS